MIRGKSVLAIITARGGSKGIPRKNIRMIAGKPLIAWTIEEAKKSRYIDRLILSSEDAEIIQVANNYGCEVPFTRPSNLSRDETPGVEPVLHAIEQLPDYDYIVLLQPTSPLRIVEDIDGAIEKCINLGVSSCVTVTEPNSSPYWMYTFSEDQILVPLFPKMHEIPARQKLPKAYVLNGAVYVVKSELLLQQKSFILNDTVAYSMPPQRSIDLDDEFDIFIIEQYIKSTSTLNSWSLYD